MKLLVGLGNPGKQYEKTRHNIGFMVLDELSRRKKFDFAPSSYKGEWAQISHGQAGRVLFLKPQTFMNLSGQSAAPLAQFYKIPPEDVLAIYDDLDLPLGRLRFAAKGGAGGHNGVKSLIQCLGSEAFPRLKIGIGRPIHPGQDAADYVLQGFTSEQKPQLAKIIELAAEAAEYFMEHSVQEAMNRYNGLSVAT